MEHHRLDHVAPASGCQSDVTSTSPAGDTVPLTNRVELSNKNRRPDQSPRGAELRAVLPPSGCQSDVTSTSPAGATVPLTNRGELGHKNRRPDPSPRGAELRGEVSVGVTRWHRPSFEDQVVPPSCRYPDI